jgi:hypothetical protein
VKKVVKVKVKAKKSSMANHDSAKKGNTLNRGKSAINIKPNFSREISNDQFLSTIKIP